MIRHQLNQKQKTLKEIVVTCGGLSELSINTKSLFNASDCVYHIFYEIERFEANWFKRNAKKNYVIQKVNLNYF